MKESDGVPCLMRRGAVLSKDKKPILRYQEYVWQKLLGKKTVAIVCPIHFETRLDKMDFSAAKFLNAITDLRYVKI